MSNCKDCDDCARHAYSDATTPGFFYDKCEKHRLTPAAPPFLPSKGDDCKRGFVIQINQHTPVLGEVSPEEVREAVAEAIEQLGVNIQEEVDFTLEVSRMYSNAPSLPSGKQDEYPEWMDDAILICGKHAVVFTKESDECFVCTNRQPSGKPTEEEARQLAQAAREMIRAHNPSTSVAQTDNPAVRPCPFCNGKKTAMACDSINGKGEMTNPREAVCMVCKGTGVEPPEEDGTEHGTPLSVRETVENKLVEILRTYIYHDRPRTDRWIKRRSIYDAILRLCVEPATHVTAQLRAENEQLRRDLYKAIETQNANAVTALLAAKEAGWSVAKQEHLLEGNQDAATVITDLRAKLATVERDLAEKEKEIKPFTFMPERIATMLAFWDDVCSRSFNPEASDMCEIVRQLQHQLSKAERALSDQIAITERVRSGKNDYKALAQRRGEALKLIVDLTRDDECDEECPHCIARAALSDDDGCVARCDRPDRHEGGHVDSVIAIGWPSQPSGEGKEK